MPFFLLPLAFAAKAIVVKVDLITGHHAATAAVHQAAYPVRAHAGNRLLSMEASIWLVKFSAL